MNFVLKYSKEVQEIAEIINPSQIEDLVLKLAEIRNQGGRLFFLGVGGVRVTLPMPLMIFAKLQGFEAYTPTDNASELTARVNDDGWESVFVNWLKGSSLNKKHSCNQIK